MVMTRWRNKSDRKNMIESVLEDSCKVIFLDTETTGLGTDAEIIQFSAIRYDMTESETGRHFEKVDYMDTFIRPKNEVSEKITSITGITNEMLACAEPEEAVARSVFNYISDAVIIGYNIGFDIRMLNQMAKRTGYPALTAESLDVMQMAKDFIPKSDISDHKLGTVAGYILPDSNFRFHSAIEDVMATAELFFEFVNMYRSFESDMAIRDMVHLEKAGLFINPRKKSEQRIKLQLSSGEYGDIFWDVVGQEWGCCTNTRAKRLFNSINLENLERQFLEMYGYRFGNNTPKEVADAWMKFRREQKVKS